MELITQNALIPGTPRLSWLRGWDELHYLAWEWELVQNVNRPTENAALRRIFKHARLYSRSVIPMLTPTHRWAMQLETYYMREFGHWTQKDVRREMAIKMHVTENKVKAILEHADIVCELYEMLGWGNLLN